MKLREDNQTGSLLSSVAFNSNSRHYIKEESDKPDGSGIPSVVADPDAAGKNKKGNKKRKGRREGPEEECETLLEMVSSRGELSMLRDILVRRCTFTQVKPG